jgi:hypothetical protein
MKDSSFENLSEEVFDNILSFIWFQDQSSLIESSKGLRTRVLTPKVRSGMLESCLAKTGREVVDMHEEMLKLADEAEVSKADTLERLKELTARVTPYPTYFDWLANLVDWDKLVLNSGRSSSSGVGGDSIEFGRNTAKDHLVSVKLRPDGIECVELTPEETFFRGKVEPLGMNSGRRALLYQGRKLGGNRCCVANDHFPFLPAVTSDLSDEFGHGIASRMDYPQILRPSRVPFTRVLNNRPSLSCVSYFEVTIYNPRKPANGKNYTAEWLHMNPPCVAIGLAYPSPAKKKEHPGPMSRTESGDDLAIAIDSNSALEHFDTEPDMEQEEEEEHEEIVLGHQPFRLRRHLPGWDRQSIGYHGDDGNVFNGNSYQSATNITLGMSEFLTRGAYGQNLKQKGSDIPNITESFPTTTCPQASTSEGKKFGRGDVVGCGIVYPPLADAFTAKCVNPGESFAHYKHEGEGIVFFVKNGKVVFMTSFNVNVPPSELPRIARPWFPVVGLDSYCPVEFNFGNSGTNPFAFDVFAFEKHLFDLRRSINSVSSSSLPALNLVEELRRVPPLPPIPHSGMNVVLPEAPSSDVKEDINDSNSSGSGSSRANDMLAAIIRPLRVVASLGSDTAVQQMRSGRCLRGNFIDWTRSLRIMSKTSDDKETSSYGLLPLSAGMSLKGSASTAAAEWNDGILSILSSKGRGYYSRCADLAIDVCTCYETRRSAQPPLVGISSIGSKLSEAGSSRSRSGSNLSVSEERSRSSSRAGSFTITAKSPGHFKAWEDAGEHLSAHSLFLNSSLSAAIKSMLRAYRLHSRVILDEVVRDHREGQYERVAAGTRSRLINMFERSFNAAGGDAASQMMVDAAVEEVWQMILPDDGEEDGEEEGAESDDLGEHVAEENIELDSGSEDSDDESYVDEDGEILEEGLAYELDSDEESLHTSSDEGDTEGQGVQYRGEGA